MCCENPLSRRAAGARAGAADDGHSRDDKIHMADEVDQQLKFSVKHAGMSLKITLDSKWQKKSLLAGVVMPFIKSFNKKRPDYDAVHEDGLAGILVDGTTWADPYRSAADVLSFTTSTVELHFEPKDVLATRSCRVSSGETEFKIELDRKWLRSSFRSAVVVPFVVAYNKKHSSPLVPTPLDAATLSAVSFDDGAPLDDLSAEVERPACLLLPRQVKCVQLMFGGTGGGGVAGSTGRVGNSGGAVALSKLSPEQLAERLSQFWTRVRTTAEGLASAREATWTNFRLGPADGAVVGAALLAASRIRCAGSWDGESCGNLLTLSLQNNDLRCDGLIGLVHSGALDRAIMCSLRELHLQSNRIGDRGAEALFTRADLPNLKILQLQDNSIGEAGVVAINGALRSSRFGGRHLNLLENLFAADGEAAEALRQTGLTKYCELKLPAKPQDRIPSAKEQMRALSIS